tara:strand:+ start:836 stop:1027 length:192 start_codon:yes stop_codon:yes gene_type:complete
MCHDWWEYVYALATQKGKTALFGSDFPVDRLALKNQCDKGISQGSAFHLSLAECIDLCACDKN